MNILVCNVGSTLLKYRLFDMDGEGDRGISDGREIVRAFVIAANEERIVARRAKAYLEAACA